MVILMGQYSRILFFLFLFVSLKFSSSSSFPSFSANTSLHLCSNYDRLALIEFKNSFSLNSDASLYYCPTSYPKTKSWKKGRDCCSWDGVTCDTVTGRVIGLDLRCSRLQGSLYSNNSLFRLSHLQKLNLAFNNFSGSKISSKFGMFESLTHLNLSFSRFSGNVPSEFSSLSKLISLHISHVKIESPTLRGFLQNCTAVQDLFFDYVDMSSVNPGLLMHLSSSLTSLHLHYCQLRGKFPENVLLLPNLQLLHLVGDSGLSIDLPMSNWSTPLRDLQLDLIDFAGDLAESICNLTHLFRLSMQNNNLHGRIPSSLSNLTKLESLSLSRNQLVGPVPDFSNLSKLVSLDLSSNLISETIPSSLSNLTKLEFLSLSSNQLVGPIPDFSNLSKLVYLYLYGNSLSGTIPSSLSNLTKLEWLSLSSNQLVGPVPDFSNISKLVSVDLSNNPISGTISSSLSNLTKLEFLYLSSNQLVGPVPDLSNLSKLVYLDLSNNSLNGTIPSSLSNLTKLELLSLSSNQLVGTIPNSIFNLTKSLEEIDMSYNKLQGPIPSSVFGLINLTTLSLSSNNLTGVVWTDNFLKLKNLVTLDLSSNSLSPLNPKANHKNTLLSNLRGVFLRSCGIAEFPNFLRGARDLTRLDLSSNNIQGPVPNWMWDVGRQTLTDLNLSYNSLTGIARIPWKNLAGLDFHSNLLQGQVPVLPFRLSFFRISANNLTGEIPTSICNMTSIGFLDISKNALSGIIPECIGNLTYSLDFLHLQNNSFHGKIPRILREDCFLRSLNLNGNQLVGPLSRSLANCKGLEILDLGNNMINDTFPHWLGILPELQGLVLKSNQFHGPILDYKAHHSFPNLRIFDISNNDFVGPLPTNYIKNMKAMMDAENNSHQVQYMGGSYTFGDEDSLIVTMKGAEYELLKIITTLKIIDFSCNKFEGEVPKFIGNLSLLIGLNFSHNLLSGHIPSSMGNLKELEWLDFSCNEFVGKIPEQLAGLTFLSHLNLSHNKLVGPIPQDKQFNTFDNSSYEGNSGLCGFPLSKTCGNDGAPPQSQPLPGEEDDSGSGLDWKFIMMGYGSGLVMGLSIGYMVFVTGKPRWLVRLVEGSWLMQVKRPNRRQSRRRR